MDEISLLRRSRNDIPERTPQDIAHGRAALFRAIEDESPFSLFAGVDSLSVVEPRVRRHRQAMVWTGFSALTATGLTVAIVAANVFGIGGVNGGADPAAASVLESAASATLEFSDPAVGPGQYKFVRTDAVFAGSGNVEADGPVVAFLEKSHEELYVPSRRTDDWVWISCTRTPFQTFGPESEALAELFGLRGDTSIFRRLAGGAGASGEPLTGYNNGTRKPSDDYDALPRDPQQLLDRIFTFNGRAGQSRDGEALVWIADTLRWGTVPAEVRAALYGAAALIPGVTITDAQATLNGAKGIAIGRVETASNIRQDLIIDPTTGQFIGERQVALDSDNGLPAGTTIASTAVTTTIVDAAPSDTSTCGVRE